MIFQSFKPRPQQTKNISVSTSPQNVPVNFASGRNTSVLVSNASSGTVFVEFYHTSSPSVPVSATASMPVLAGTVQVFDVNVSESGILYAHVIAPSGTGTVYFTPGEGS